METNESLLSYIKKNNLSAKIIINNLLNNRCCKKELFIKHGLPYKIKTDIYDRIRFLIINGCTLQELVCSDLYTEYFMKNMRTAPKPIGFHKDNLWYITDGENIYLVDEYFWNHIKVEKLFEEAEPENAYDYIKEICSLKKMIDTDVHFPDYSTNARDYYVKNKKEPLISKVEKPMYYTTEAGHIDFIKVRISLAGMRGEPSSVKENIEDIKSAAINYVKQDIRFKKFQIPITAFAITNMALLSTWQVEITFEIKKELR